MAKAKASKGGDWFDALDAELQRRTQEVQLDVGEQRSKRAELNRALIEDLWKVWKRFHAANVTLVLEPNPDRWATFEDTYPDGAWRWRDAFNAAATSEITLTDRTPAQGRIGDALQITHYEANDRIRLKVTFEYCEGEHYYKYSGWKRIWSIHTLYDALVDRVDLDAVHKVFSDVVKAWYESHLRRNRDILIRHLKKNYERVETYNQ